MNQSYQSIQILVSGTVQGVGFRWATRQVAINIGISGSVQNLSNGQVKIVACGTAQNIKRFLKVIKASPTPYGNVKQVKVKNLNYNFNTGSFIVK